MNKIWSFLIIGSILTSILTGNFEKLGKIIIDSSMKGWDVFLQTGVLILFWGGIFQIAIDSGMIKKLSKILKKPIHYVFPEIPYDSRAYEYICSNIIANILGLGSAATPMGLMAFKEMKKLSKEVDVPSRSMITLIAINASSITIVPTTIIGMRVFYNGTTNIFTILLMMATTILSTIIALFLDRFFYKRSLKK